MAHTPPQDDLIFDYKYGFSMEEKPIFTTPRGLSEQTVRDISAYKKEPAWMLDLRLKAYAVFKSKKMPDWGADLQGINFDDITYFASSTPKQMDSWEELPSEIIETYNRIGVPQAERDFLAGVSAQYDSEVVYESIQKELTKLGVFFCDMDTALRLHPKLVQEYFGKLIPAGDNIFSALNTAVWSGGSFVYVPAGVHVKLPLQAYFRINAERFGQFERTLIIAEEGSSVGYVEGCLPAGEQISTCTGWANIESVQPGDIVRTHTGGISHVAKTMCRKFKGIMYTVTPLSPFNTFSLTEEHPVLAVKRENVCIKRKQRNGWLPEVNSELLRSAKPEFIPVSMLKKGDFLMYPKPHHIIASSECEFTDEELEVLGFYTAEGSAHYHTSLKQYMITFTMSEKEMIHIKRIQDLLKVIIGKRGSIAHDKRKHALTLTVYSRELFKLCTYHCGKYSKRKILSDELMHVQTDKIMKFYDSYFIGDGNISSRGGRKSSTLRRVSTASRDLAVQLQYLLSRVGIFASILIRKEGNDVIHGRQIHRSEQYILTYTDGRTWSEIRENESYYIIPIRSISHALWDDYVFNIEVKGVESYLVKGFAVHNCTAPVYTTDSLHAAVVEIFVKPHAHVRYTTVQNWSNNVYNLVTKRARAQEHALMEWIDCNIGSKVTMKYPSVYLTGEGARGEVLSIAYAGPGQHQDAGAKMLHLAPHTSSRVISKSISRGSGRTSYRGLVTVHPDADDAQVYVSCDALLLDDQARTDTYPTMKIKNKTAEVQHEATVERLGEEKLCYIMSRGIKRADAESMLVNGFIEPVTKEIPLEYTVELNRLIQLEMEGSVG